MLSSSLNSLRSKSVISQWLQYPSNIFDSSRSRKLCRFSINLHHQVNSSQSFQIPKLGKLKLLLESEKLFGISQSRGERAYQEDFVKISNIHLNLKECSSDLQSHHLIHHLQPSRPQALFVGIFDGHGGIEASEYLKDHLDSIVEDCEAEEIPEVIRAYRQLGGYFRRFRGGLLENLGQQMYAKQATTNTNTTTTTPSSTPTPMEMGERLTLAFLKADQHLITSSPQSGAVGTVAILQSIPTQATSTQEMTIYPFYSSPLISLTLAHLGDTLALLCSSSSGQVFTLTQAHHPDSRVESERLRRIGTGLITDSFGESRWGGSLANTRGLGDANFKRLGVTGEPEIINKLLKGLHFFFLLFHRHTYKPTEAQEVDLDGCCSCSGGLSKVKNGHF